MLKQKGFAIIKNHFGNVSITSKNGHLDVFDDYNSAAHCLDDSESIIDYKIEEVVIIEEQKDEKRNKTEVDVSGEIVELVTYLNEHNIEATYDEIVLAAIRLAKRLGSDKWSFVCELKKRGK